MQRISLSIAQWKVIQEIIAPRKPKYLLQDVMQGLLYLVKIGCQWRMLPDCSPIWQLVYYYFSRWRGSGLIEELLHRLREIARRRIGKNASASLGIMDSQSVKSGCSRAMKGFDGNKKVNGRKRHIVVDTNGWLLAILVHVANIHDSKAAPLLLRRLKESLQGIRLLFADGGYRGELIEKVKDTIGCMLQIVPRAAQGGVSPKRWVVERTFSWFSYQRRLAMDYEYLNETAEAMVQLAAIKILIRKI